MKNIIPDFRLMKRYIIFVSIFFVFAILLGYLAAISDPAGSRERIYGALSQFTFLKNLNLFWIFLFIFLNNVIKGFMVVLLGAFLGVLPLIFIFINGELLGEVIGISFLSGELSKTFFGILTHGILEIPAIILSASYGIWLGYKVYRKIRHRELFAEHFHLAMRAFFILILPLFFLAAIVETFITPSVMNLFD